MSAFMRVVIITPWNACAINSLQLHINISEKTTMVVTKLNKMFSSTHEIIIKKEIRKMYRSPNLSSLSLQILQVTIYMDFLSLTPKMLRRYSQDWQTPLLFYPPPQLLKHNWNMLYRNGGRYMDGVKVDPVDEVIFVPFLKTN